MSPSTAILALSLFLAAPVELLPAGDRPTNLTLPDQFGQLHAVTECLGNLLVLVYGDRQAENLDRALRDRLAERFHQPVAGAPPGIRSPEVRVAAVACLRGTPDNMQFIIQRHFAATSPKGLVLLDFHDRMRQEFGLAPGLSQVVVFDVAGRPRIRTIGSADGPTVEGIVQAIEALRAEAVQALAPPR